MSGPKLNWDDDSLKILKDSKGGQSSVEMKCDVVAQDLGCEGCKN